MGRNQRGNELQQPLQRPAIRGDGGLAGCAAPLTLSRIRKQPADLSSNGVRIWQDAGSPAGNQQRTDISSVLIVRAGNDRYTERDRFKQVVSADGSETATDKSHICGGIEGHKLTHGIA